MKVARPLPSLSAQDRGLWSEPNRRDVFPFESCKLTWLWLLCAVAAFLAIMFAAIEIDCYIERRVGFWKSFWFYALFGALCLIIGLVARDYPL